MLKLIFVTASVFYMTCLSTSLAEAKTLVCNRQDPGPFKYYSRFAINLRSATSGRVTGELSSDSAVWHQVCVSIGDFSVTEKAPFFLFSGKLKCKESPDSLQEMKLDSRTMLLNTKADLSGLEYHCEWSGAITP